MQGSWGGEGGGGVEGLKTCVLPPFPTTTTVPPRILWPVWSCGVSWSAGTARLGRVATRPIDRPYPLAPAKTYLSGLVVVLEASFGRGSVWLPRAVVAGLDGKRGGAEWRERG